MESGIKRRLWAMVLAAFFLAIGVYIARFLPTDDGGKTAVEASVLLEQVKNVVKLVTVEGYFSEIYSEENTQTYWGFPSTKKILIKVKAKVAAGYDLSQMTVTASEVDKTIRIAHIPPPAVIAIEPEISYYDISNGVFNSFSEADYTRLNKKAVDLVREQAQSSALMASARRQGLQHFDQLALLAQRLGWRIEFSDTPGLSK